MPECSLLELAIFGKPFAFLLVHSTRTKITKNHTAVLTT